MPTLYFPVDAGTIAGQMMVQGQGGPTFEARHMDVYFPWSGDRTWSPHLPEPFEAIVA
jgi:hypothetical protein